MMCWQILNRQFKNTAMTGERHVVTGRMRHEAFGSMCKLLIIDMVKNTGRVEQMANRYIEGKADEYLSKRAWSSIGEQYPEGLTRGVIQVHKQWSRQGQTESKWKASNMSVNPIYKAEDQEPHNNGTRIY